MAEEVVGSSLYFGIDPIESLEAVGVVQSYTENNTVEISEAKNERGKIIEQRAFSKTCEVSIEALVKVGATLPGVGTSLTAGGFTGLISSINVTSSNGEYKKVSISATRKDSAALVGLTA